MEFFEDERLDGMHGDELLDLAINDPRPRVWLAILKTDGVDLLDLIQLDSLDGKRDNALKEIARGGHFNLKQLRMLAGALDDPAFDAEIDTAVEQQRHQIHEGSLSTEDARRAAHSMGMGFKEI